MQKKCECTCKIIILFSIIFLGLLLRYLLLIRNKQFERFGEDIRELFKNSIYINLDTRNDRRIATEKEMRKIGLNPVRFNAIKHKKGAIGCSMSHLNCIKIAKKNNWDYVMVCEDDIQFDNPALFFNQLNKFLKMNLAWDVILIAGNNYPPFQKVGDCCIKVNKCKTTTGYITRKNYYDKLINNFSEGIYKFLKDQENTGAYAIDMYWMRLQKNDNWYLITPITVVQRADYSDIEKKVVDYTEMMKKESKNE